LLVMGDPIVALLFQRGEFMPADTRATVEALRFSILGLVFAALDQPLIFAFYARKDTWTPALVGVGTVALYVVLAVVPTLFGPPQLWALILANSLKLMAHALLMLYLFSRKVGSLRPYRIRRTTLAALGASLLMVIPVALTLSVLRDVVPAGALGYLIRVLAAGGAGGIAYLIVLRFMDVEEVTLLRQALRRPPIAEA
jgi:putative peptidoglycan lipid II flippase